MVRQAGEVIVVADSSKLGMVSPPISCCWRSPIASMKLKHVDLKAGCVYQDVREVKTKFRKSFTTHFLPVGEGMQEIVVDRARFPREIARIPKYPHLRNSVPPEMPP